MVQSKDEGESRYLQQGRPPRVVTKHKRQRMRKMNSYQMYKKEVKENMIMVEEKKVQK